VFSASFDGTLGRRAWGHVPEKLLTIYEEVVLEELANIGTWVSH